MPIEYEMLRNVPPAMKECPVCLEPRPDFLRGQVQSSWRKFLRLPYCAVICHCCRNIIGWERPPNRRMR